MIVTTTETVPGREIAEALGVARGSVVRARFFGRDILAGLRSIVGGEIDEYTRLLAQSREQAYTRMIEHAQAMNADAVVNVRFTTTTMMQGSAEMLAYGTAVRFA